MQTISLNARQYGSDIEKNVQYTFRAKIKKVTKSCSSTRDLRVRINIKPPLVGGIMLFKTIQTILKITASELF